MALVAAVALMGQVGGFTMGSSGGSGERRSTTIPSTRRSTTVNNNTPLLRVSATDETDFASAMPPTVQLAGQEEVDPHDIIGVKPELLAIGINPDEFLEWVGT
jgi:hypothetical protein